MIKVLVAEDDAFLSSLIIQSLRAGNFDAHASYDGIQALAEIKQWHPDVVLLDLLMPGKDGFQVLEELRADSELAKTHVMVLSNLSDEASVDRVKRLDVTEYVVKANITPHEMVDKIRSMTS